MKIQMTADEFLDHQYESNDEQYSTLLIAFISNLLIRDRMIAPKEVVAYAHKVVEETLLYLKTKGEENE